MCKRGRGQASEHRRAEQDPGADLSEYRGLAQALGELAQEPGGSQEQAQREEQTDHFVVRHAWMGGGGLARCDTPLYRSRFSICRLRWTHSAL